jgi:8-hydroxy-5-deazaflavin:NADPH oxidoreductase
MSVQLYNHEDVRPGDTTMPIMHPRIAILGGTGKEGTGLALRWAAAGYEIYIGSRQIEKAKLAAEKINQQLGNNNVTGLANTEAARLADISILTVLHTAHREAIESIKDVIGGKILVDATSRVDYHDPRPIEPPCAAEETQQLLGPNARVVAAFQNIPAKSLKQNLGQLMNADVLVCSDDMDAAEQVISLANAAGMNGYYAGPLVNAIVVEGITSILIYLNKHYGVKDASIQVNGISESIQVK